MSQSVPTGYVPPTENAFAWSLVGVPIIGALVPIAFPQVPWLAVAGIATALNVALAVEDDKRVQAAGHKSVGAGWGLLVPVYLLIRAKRTSTPLIPMAWLIVFLAAAVASVFLGPVTMDSAKLEPALGKAIRSQVGGGPVTVDCPRDPVVRVNGTFTCTAHQSGTSAQVVVTVTSHDGGYTWQVSR